MTSPSGSIVCFSRAACLNEVGASALPLRNFERKLYEPLKPCQPSFHCLHFSAGTLFFRKRRSHYPLPIHPISVHVFLGSISPTEI